MDMQDTMDSISTAEAKELPVASLFAKLDSSERGLTSAAAKARQDAYGPNEISEQKRNPVLKFLGYFWGPIAWMVEAALVLSAVIGHWDDFFIILAMLLINAAVGFYQEHKADDAIDMLKQRLALKARVLRDGRWEELTARELVPGDMVRVRLGDIIPADLKLMQGDDLLLDESALTGESLPVEKHVFDVAYSGSVVRQGEMKAMVIATGMQTYFGKTARLVEEAKTRSHFQRAVIKIGDFLIVIAAVLIGITLIVALIRHNPLLEQLQFALVLTIAAIPVAMPAVLTVTMAVGASALAKKEAIVSRLTAIEEMAGMDVLCSDKTGTITKNEIRVAEVQALEGFETSDVLTAGMLASREDDRDPIDNAIIAKVHETPEIREGMSSYEVGDFKPFDPVIKRTEVSVRDVDEGTAFKVAKGAPQVILELLGEEGGSTISGEVSRYVDEYATRGHRALGVARTDDGGTWRYIGLIALNDPPRDDSAETIAMAQEMGIEVKMVTGDHIAIAREIAREVNLRPEIQPASAFIDAPDEEAGDIVEAADGFAQVFPEHKYRIVELLQSRNHIVGMTGDGVNDAPALKKADAGIAVAGATDAAKSAAAIVLTLPGLSVIIDAIRESRKIFQRMTSYAVYRIAETIRVLFFITLAILIFNFYPLTPIMIVLLALLNDIPIMMIAYDNAKVYPQPERWNMRDVLSIATFIGFIGLIFSFGLYLAAKQWLHLDGDTIQTLMFLKLAVGGHFTIYLTRSGKLPFWAKPYPSWRLILAAESTQVVATFFAVYGILMYPVGWSKALLVWAYVIVAFFITNFVKERFYRWL
ncbi:MAG: plasma-membrane proton-efflux P-type ATPase [Actinobacteria bacterium]|nr:plasma-membrane proton-efflux P-type ATPase [Actinomycetota bacterium]